MREANLWENGLPQGIAVLSNLLNKSKLNVKLSQFSIRFLQRMNHK